jgi:hypothetical protein
MRAAQAYHRRSQLSGSKSRTISEQNSNFRPLSTARHRSSKFTAVTRTTNCSNWPARTRCSARSGDSSWRIHRPRRPQIGFVFVTRRPKVHPVWAIRALRLQDVRGVGIAWIQEPDFLVRQLRDRGLHAAAKSSSFRSATCLESQIWCTSVAYSGRLPASAAAAS